MRELLVENQNMLKTRRGLTIGSEGGSIVNQAIYKTRDTNFSNVVMTKKAQAILKPKLLANGELNTSEISVKNQDMRGKGPYSERIDIVRSSKPIFKTMNSPQKKSFAEVPEETNPPLEEEIKLSTNIRKLFKRKNIKEMKKSFYNTRSMASSSIIQPKEPVFIHDITEESHGDQTDRNEIEREIDHKIKSNLEKKWINIDNNHQRANHDCIVTKSIPLEDLPQNCKNKALIGRFLTNREEQPPSSLRPLDKLEFINQKSELRRIKEEEKTPEKVNKLSVEKCMEKVKIIPKYEKRFSPTREDKLKVKMLPLNRIKDQAPYYSIVTLQREESTTESYGSNYSYGGEKKSFLEKIIDREYTKGNKPKEGFKDFLIECKDQVIITNQIINELEGKVFEQQAYRIQRKNKSKNNFF